MGVLESYSSGFTNADVTQWLERQIKNLPIQGSNSIFRSKYAWVVKLVATLHLSCSGHNGCTSSNLVPGTCNRFYCSNTARQVVFLAEMLNKHKLLRWRNRLAQDAYTIKVPGSNPGLRTKLVG